MLSQEIKFARMLSKNRKYAGIMSNDKKIYTWYCPSMIKTRKLFPKKKKTIQGCCPTKGLQLYCLIIQNIQ